MARRPHAETCMRIITLILKLLLAIVVLVLAAYAYIHFSVNRRVDKTYAVSPPAVPVPLGDAAAIERGRYLAQNVSMCAECHGEDLAGRMVIESPVMGNLGGSNLTRGRGGIGSTYSDDDLVRAIVHGVRKDGRSVVFMPSQDYKFTRSDVGALIAYLRSLPPVDRTMPPPTPGPMARILTATGAFPLLPAEMIDHDRITFAPEERADTAEAAGEYLISSAGCRGCHGPTLSGEGGMPDASNLTPVGIGHYTQADFTRALREWKRPNGTEIKPEMPRAFGQLSDEDIAKMFSYLKTVPPGGTKSKGQQL